MADSNAEHYRQTVIKLSKDREDCVAMAARTSAIFTELRGALQEYMRVLRWNPEHCQFPGTCMHCVATKRAKAALEMKP